MSNQTLLHNWLKLKTINKVIIFRDKLMLLSRNILKHHIYMCYVILNGVVISSVYVLAPFMWREKERAGSRIAKRVGEFR